MAGTSVARVEDVGKRICYSCGNSYPDAFRFCPKDSADLEYLPEPIENLAKDFRRPKRWIAAPIISALFLILVAFLVVDRLDLTPAGGNQGFGELTVRTTPAGAKVYLDGSQVGVSPVRLSDIPTGFHEVRAVFPGYTDGKAHVEILPSATQKLIWDLSPLPSRKTKDRNRYLAELLSKDIPSQLKMPADPAV